VPPPLPPAGIQSRAGSVIGSQGTEPGGTRAGNRSGRREEKRRRRRRSESGGGNRDEVENLEGKCHEPSASSAFGGGTRGRRLPRTPPTCGGTCGGTRFLVTGMGASCREGVTHSEDLE